MKKMTFYEPIYFTNVEVVFTKQPILKASVDQYEKNGLVYYKLELEDNQDFYMLMHECLHLVERVFTDRNIPFTADNSESIAYYQCFWFKKIWRNINKPTTVGKRTRKNKKT